MKQATKQNFNLLFEQKDKLSPIQMNSLKGGSPDGCVDISIGWIVCTTITIGKAQPPPEGPSTEQ